MEQGLNTYYYCVAQHLFAVHCADKALFERISNYEPFRVEAQGEPIFALRIEQDGLLSEEERSHYAHVFTDNSEEDMPRIEVYREVIDDGQLAIGDKGWLMRVSQIAQSPICCELQR